MIVRQIYETAQTEGEVKRRLRELIEYIKWKHGWQTMEAYEHYFDAARHAEIQDMLYEHFEESLKQDLSKRKDPQISKQQASMQAFSEQVTRLALTDPDFDFLCSIGGGYHGNA
ncbi:MAG TPA: hypothetical protein VFV38_23265 [Ktedonobacteraceae bacterium]|nr:hypothetical protein [Ktedonobacteraceae bacterium]